MSARGSSRARLEKLAAATWPLWRCEDGVDGAGFVVAVLAEVPPTRGAVRVLEARAASPGRAWAKALAGVRRLARDRARQYAERARAAEREAERLDAHAEAILAALRADHAPRGERPNAETSERPNV